jgi:hypothetical protein
VTDNDANEPKILDIPIGLDATGMRREFDSLGDVEVPADRYWGAQTQRSLKHFNIGNDRMPKEVYHAYGYGEEGRRHRQHCRRAAAGLEGAAWPTGPNSTGRSSPSPSAPTSWPGAPWADLTTAPP